MVLGRITVDTVSMTLFGSHKSPDLAYALKGIFHGIAGKFGKVH